MLLRLITVFNWLVIALLAFLLVAELLNPKRGYGGDAATRGLGDALVWLAGIALVVLVILNLIPHRFAKYAALALVAIPALIFWATPRYRNFKRTAQMKMEDARPIFEDNNLEALARAVRQGDVDRFRSLLEKRPPGLENNGEFLNFLLLEANSSYAPEAKLQCLQLFFDAGAKLENMGPGYETMHFEAAASGNAPLLRLLLEKGLDANALQTESQRPILFEAIESYREPEATVRLLLEFGAKPNVTAIRDSEDGPVSPLFHAAKWDRWGICAALLEHGADPNVKSATGTTFRQMFEEANRNFDGDGYTTREDFERAKRLMRNN